MIYYQVTDRLAQVNGHIFAPGELFTEKEMDKSKYRKDNKEFFVMREIKKSKVYWSFGVRKEIKGE